jgi:transposase-like protein
LAELLEDILNQVLETQAEDQLGAGRYERSDELAAQMEGKATKAIQCLENGLEDALAVMALPAKYRRRMKSTNMQERLIQEVRRRERVIRIFPNEASALRLIGALLAEVNEEWQVRRYLDMTAFHQWQAERESRIGKPMKTALGSESSARVGSLILSCSYSLFAPGKALGYSVTC